MSQHAPQRQGARQPDQGKSDHSSPEPAEASFFAPGVASVLFLQRAAGNQAVLQFLRSTTPHALASAAQRPAAAVQTPGAAQQQAVSPVPIQRTPSGPTVQRIYSLRRADFPVDLRAFYADARTGNEAAADDDELAEDWPFDRRLSAMWFDAADYDGFANAVRAYQLYAMRLPSERADGILDREVARHMRRGVRRRGGAAQTGTLSEFALHFNREFRSVLHAFAERAEGEGPVAYTPRGQPRVVSGEEVSEARLLALFTETQRQKLMQFFSSRRIPERLFNSGDAGEITPEGDPTLSAQQRLLLSAHILANGTYRPGSFEQRVHARMCFHWAQIVHHYAGVTPATGPLTFGVMGGLGPLGGAVLGSGREQAIYGGAQVFAEDLPTTEIPAGGESEGGGPGGVGPLDPGTGHAEAAQEQQRQGGRPTRGPRVHRRVGMPFERFGEIQPGDWLWYYTANASAGGGHSVIFSRWTSEDQVSPVSGAHYREAICFSQNRPERGGSEHRARLGDMFSRAEHIYPITNVMRVRPSARPATTPEELLPGPTAARAARLSEENRRFLEARAAAVARGGRRQPVRPVDLELLRRWIRDQNEECIDRLETLVTEGGEPLLTPHQLTLLRQANQREEIETLVRLNQRLRALETNAGILARNMESTFTGALAERRTRAETRLEELERELQEIDAQLEPVRRAMEEQRQRERDVDLSDEIRLHQRELHNLWQQIRRLRAGPEREALLQERQRLQERIGSLQGRQQQRERQVELREIRAQIRVLRGQLSRLQARRRQAESRRAEAERRLPYGSMHPGRLGGEERGSPTGRLADLSPQPPWAELVVDAAE